MSRSYCMVNFTLTEKDEVINANNVVKTAIVAVDNVEYYQCSAIIRTAIDKIKMIYSDKTVNLIDYTIFGNKENIMFIN